MVDLCMEELASQLGICYLDIDVASVHLPPGETVGIPSDDDDLYQEDDIKLDTGFGYVIIVDNLPVVPPEKFKKLEIAIRKIFNQKIGFIREDGLWMPIDPDTQKTLGYCFIEYNTAEEAKLAKETRNGYRMDKYHICAVNMFEDFDRLTNVPDWVPPEVRPYTAGENLQHWLTDDKARDQFVILAGSDAEVFWNDDARQLKPDPVYRRPSLTKSFVKWSPMGTYLATLHMAGVQLWGGPSTFDLLMRYAHPQVNLIDFSPGEKYLVTYSSHKSRDPRDPQTVVINIFEVRTGKLMRDFKGTADDFAVGGTGGVTGITWPFFRWCGGKDDKYFARIGKNVVSIYETETFSLIDKKSLRVENVADFSCSPTDPIVAVFVPEFDGGNQHARVSLVQIPGKEELRQKNLFSVSNYKMYWQSNGDYLAIKVDQYTKTKKRTYTGFELFRIKECDIPIEVLELENKNDKVLAFAWEPKGHRFAVIHGDNPTPDISFYTMKSGNNLGRLSKLTTLKEKQANALFWSPGGKYIILAGLKNLNGQLEFYNVDELETMACAEHFKATFVEWDPSGRYVVSAVTSGHNEMESGFYIWSFHGKLLYRTLKDNFFQFSWRPRPPSFLSPEKEEEIAKNLKKYIKKYKAEDQNVLLQLIEQDQERRRKLTEEWDKWVSWWRQLKEEEKLLHIEEANSDNEEEEEYDMTEEVEVEELLYVSEVATFDDSLADW